MITFRGSLAGWVPGSVHAQLVLKRVVLAVAALLVAVFTFMGVRAAAGILFTTGNSTLIRDDVSPFINSRMVSVQTDVPVPAKNHPGSTLKISPSCSGDKPGICPGIPVARPS
jgi:hypothetical protein